MKLKEQMKVNQQVKVVYQERDSKPVSDMGASIRAGRSKSTAEERWKKFNDAKKLIEAETLADEL